MKLLRAATLGVCALGLCACGSGDEAPAKVLARKSATGRHASATASFKFTILSDLSVHVAASPAQRVTGGWVISCGYGMFQTSRQSGDFARRTPIDMDIPVDLTAQSNEQCELVAVGTLARSGRVTVVLRGRQS
jgi:hypothetical protein